MSDSITTKELCKAYLAKEMIWIKNRSAPLVGIDEIFRLMKLKIIDNVPKIYGCGNELHYRKCKINFHAEEFSALLYKEYHSYCSLIVDILELGEGKLFLCGGAVLSMLDKLTRQKNMYFPKDYDIFFCCEDEFEAESIMRQCLKYIDDKYNKVKYKASQSVITVCINDNPERQIIQFIKRVYKSPDQILLGFDNWACQHGWNPQIGYFTLETGALAFATNAFSVNISKRSFHFGDRLKKYNNKGFDIYLPGYPDDLDLDVNLNLTNKDLSLQLKCKNGKYYGTKHNYINNIFSKVRCPSNNFKCPCHFGPIKCKMDVCTTTEYWLVDYNHGNDIMYPLVVSDYESSTSRNDEILDLGKIFLFTFSSKILEEILSPDISIDNIHSYNVLISQNHINEINSCRCGVCIESTVKLLNENFNNPSKSWKTEDPGSQTFGQFSPILEHAKEWYGEKYTPFHIGIQPDKFVALYECWKKSNTWNGINKDLFRLICDYNLFLTSKLEYEN